MNQNPYDPPVHNALSFADSVAITRYPTMSVILSVIASIAAFRQLPPLLSDSVLSFSISAWLTGFLPAFYFLFAATFALWTEFRGNSAHSTWLTFVLLPLILITGVILVATLGYVRSVGLAFLLDWRTVLVLSICPFVWCYFVMCLSRWRSSRCSAKR